MISFKITDIYQQAAAGMGYSVARLAAATVLGYIRLISDGLENLAQDGIHTSLLDVTIHADVQLTLLTSLTLMGL